MNCLILTMRLAINIMKLVTRLHTNLQRNFTFYNNLSVNTFIGLRYLSDSNIFKQYLVIATNIKYNIF